MPATELGPIEGVAVLGTGTALPPLRLSNVAVLRWLFGDTRDEDQLRFAADGIHTTLGLSTRAWTHAVGQPVDHAMELSTLDLAVEAARTALADAGLPSSALSLVVCATSTPHRFTGTLSAAVGAALGAEAACMDTRAGCAGGIFALATAALFVAANGGYALVVGAETFSKVIPPGHKMACLSLGDGAAALVLGRRKGAAILSAFLETDGTLGRLVNTPGALPPVAKDVERGAFQLAGDADELAAVVPDKYALALRAALRRADVAVDELDLYVPHATSRPLIEAVVGRLGFSLERAWDAGVAQHANIGAAGWLAGLAAARAEGRVPSGAHVAVAAVGGGMSWAAAVLRV